MNEIFQVPAAITNIKTMSKALRIQVDTQENLSPEAMKRLFELYDSIGWFTFAARTIEEEDLLELPEIKTDSRRTPSQRLRAVIFRLWEKDDHGYDVFDNFYAWYMESLIERIKEKLG